jgi:hypothetical protein
VGEFFSIWVNFVQFAGLGEIHPNQQNFARKILERNLTARIHPFQTSFTQKSFSKIDQIQNVIEIIIYLSRSLVAANYFSKKIPRNRRNDGWNLESGIWKTNSFCAFKLCLKNFGYISSDLGAYFINFSAKNMLIRLNWMKFIRKILN